MKKFTVFFSLLVLVAFIPLAVFAGETPQKVTLKKGAGEKELSATYSPVQELGRFQGKFFKNTFQKTRSSNAVYLSEGFEGAVFPPAGWTLWNVGAGFVTTSTRVHSGTLSAYHNDDSGQQDDWMVTPAIDLTGSSSARLNFWQNENFSSWAEIHRIYVTTDTTGIMGDTSAWTLVYDGIGPEDTWEQVLVDLSAYDGQTIYLGFYYSGNFADEWYIDDVIVEDAPTAPVMLTLYESLIAPPTRIGETVSDTFGLVVNTGGGPLNISSIAIDNPDFAVSPTSATVNPGDTLFVEGSFTPSTAGEITGQMIISGDDPANPTDTVALSGFGYPTTYVNEEFNDWPYYPYNFDRIDNNADGNTWGWFLLLPDSNLVAGIHWKSSGNDDYLVTPPIPVQAGDFISFDSWAASATWPETWEVLVSTTDKNPASFVTQLDSLTSGSTTPIRYTYDLSAFAGQTIYVAIHNISVDKFYQWVDNVIMPMPNYPVFINEVYYDTPGSDVHTFTELYGMPGMSLDGYSLEGVNGNGGSTYATIDLTGNVIPGDGFFVVGEDAGVDSVDLINSSVDWQNGPDNVVLMNGADTVDALGYGNFSSAVFVGEGNPAVDVFGGVSLSRYPDGYDTNDNASDFHATYPTPGTFNHAPEPIIGGGSSLSFGNVALGDEQTKTYRIYNNGSADLVVDSVITSNPAFTVSWPSTRLDTVIAPGASASLSVTFRPEMLQTYNDSMMIYNNDAQDSVRVVSLSGTGEIGAQNNFVILAAKIGGDSHYRSFWVNGSWDSTGVYDPSWSGPMVELNDQGLGYDAVAGDSIFTGMVVLKVDSTNTYEWWAGSENDVNSYLDSGTSFSLLSPGSMFYADTLTLDGDNGINKWVISLAGSFNSWNNSSDDLTRSGTVWSIDMSLTPGTYEYKYAVMHQWNAAYGDGGVGGAGSNFVLNVTETGVYTFSFDDADNSQSVTHTVSVLPPNNLVAMQDMNFAKKVILSWSHQSKKVNQAMKRGSDKALMDDGMPLESFSYFNIYRAGPDTVFTQIATGVTDTMYVDSVGLDYDSLYFYYVTAYYDPEGESGASNIARVIPIATPPAILVVDDDGSMIGFDDVGHFYTDALDALTQPYYYYEVPFGSSGPPASFLKNFKVVIWTTGETWSGTTTLLPDDEAALAAYLDSGGSLFLNAQDYLFDIYPAAGSFSAGQFPFDYLKLTSVSQDVWVNPPSTTGAPGSVADGLTFNLASPFGTTALFVDSLATTDGTPVFDMTVPTGYSAIQYDGNYKLVFSTLDFGGLVDGTFPNTKAEFMRRVLGFLYAPLSIDDQGLVPMTFAVSQNFPNPFNPTTTISYQVPRSVNVTLQVYNVLGQRVKTLVNNRMDAGFYKAVWDGTNDYGAKVASGIYIYRLRAGDFVQVKKMIMMK